MTLVEETAETYTLSAADIQISFRYVGDRWQHFVSVRRDGDWLRILTSEEGSSERRALPSPALQDLRFEKLDDDVFEFQVIGQAGHGVYSAAVRFDGKSQEIDFDLCARGRSSDSPLCTESSYILSVGHESASVENLQPHSLVVQMHGGPAIEISPVQVPENPTTACRVLDEDSVRKIVAGSSGVTRPNATNKGISIRWRYRIAPFGHP